MARFFLVHFLILIVNAHLIFTMADENEKQKVIAQSSIIARKLGNHNNIVHGRNNNIMGAPILSPSEPPKAEESPDFSREVSASGDESEDDAAQGHVMELNHISHQHHRPLDKSVCGGGLILGGLATTFLVAIFCYIRATARKNPQPGSPNNSSMERKLNPKHGSNSPATTNSSC